ncbi:MAG: hypothetical protein ACLFUB_10540 [Cyclobacteriaceae bacterium]
MKNYILPLLTALMLSACTLPQMLVDEELASSASEMPVKGRQGLMLNQKISFGSYQSERVRRGWTRSHELDFFLAGLEGARQKYSFELFSDRQKVYTVLAAHKIKGVDLPIGRFTHTGSALRELLSFTVQTENSFAASLYNMQDEAIYRLLILNPDDIRKNGRYAGFLTNDLDHHIEILPVRKLANQKSIGNEIIDFEFREAGKAVAAVELINQGKVWINPALSPQSQHALAAACATLLLKEDIDESLN